MMYTQRRMSGVGFAGGRRLPGGSARKRGYLRRSSFGKGNLSWIGVGAAAALICALSIWIAVQMYGQGRPAYSAENQFPRNTVDMHGACAAETRALPWPRC